MKILYIGHQREKSGWGTACRNYIHAMNSIGLDIVPRAVKFDNSYLDDPLILDLEKKPLKNCDVVIQHILPHFMEYGNFKKNIGMFASETHSIKYTSWVSHLNLMDEVWVFNNQQKENLKKDGLVVPLKVVPHAVDLQKYQQIYETVKLPDELNGTFKFYFVGEFNHRKGLHFLLKAFHTEFGLPEPVSLVIKSSNSEYINNIVNQVKSGLRLYNSINDYHQECVITEYLPEHQLCSLHLGCDCLVMPSYGEGFGLPAIDALGFGNPVIATDTGAMKDYIKQSENGWLINSRKDIVFGMNHIPFDDLNTARETWDIPSILHLKSLMRDAFETWKDKRDYWNKMKVNAKNTVKNYSYEKIGNQIKELL